jgi:class I fructose-bisphosphate aldolase
MKEELGERIERILPTGKAMILAYDQGFEHGPRDFWGNPESRKLEYILDIAKRGKFTGIVLHAGLAEKYQAEIRESGVPLILKLNGKSELYTEEDPFSPQLYSVADALSFGASAVGYTVYSGSKYEDQMHKEFAQIIRQAHQEGIPAIGWMYPRGKSLFDRKSSSKTFKIAQEEKEKEKSLAIDETPSIVAYGARIGLELGADLVKVKYTGSTDSFKWVVECANPTKVVMSGGEMIEDEEFLSRIKGALNAGAVGIAVGRNVWQRPEPMDITKEIHQIIFGS